MRSLALTLLAATVCASLSTAAPVPKELKNRPDAERYVGAWDTVVSESNGQPYNKACWTFDADLKMVSNGGGGGTSHWVIKIDPTKSPKTIDIGSYPGVYDFDGADIRIAYTLGGARPLEVKSGPGVYYSVLRRVAEAKK